jgi:polysaccharide pyruvyl transferase CsaB
MPLRVASLGYVGFGNLGDEAVLAGIRVALRNRAVFRDCEWTVLTADPASTTRLHTGVRTASRRSWRESADALRGTDLFILGGGSLFQDATSVRSVLWYALMAWIARRRSKRVLWWGHGIGPLETPVARRIVAAGAARADAVTVRDSDSARLLKDCGFPGSVELVADPAFLLEQTCGPSHREGTVVALRKWRGAVPSVALKPLPGPVVGLPMHVPDDRGMLPGVSDIDWSAETEPWQTVMGTLARSEAVVAMRLHAQILACVCSTPFVPLSYDPKVDALARRTGQDDLLIPIDKFTPELLRERVEVLRAEWSRRSDMVGDAATQLRTEASLPADRAAQWWT